MDLSGMVALRGLPLCIGVSVLALGALALSAVLLPRRCARRAAARMSDHLLQAGALVLVAVLALTACGLWINRTAAMYSSWTDLLHGSGDPVSSSYGAPSRADADVARWPLAARAPVSALQAAPLRDPALPGLRRTAAGQWAEVRIPGRRSDVTSSALVHLPAGYLEHPHRRYPVILAFSGVPGSPAAFRDAFGIGALLDRLAARGAMASAIVVAPRVFPGQEDTECVDRSRAPRISRAGASARGTRWETWIAHDVADFARTHLRTIEDPAAWATFGYSAGGWCASMISVRHPELARTSISMAGYFEPVYASGQEWNAPDDPRYDLPRRVREDAPGVDMYLFTGGEDPLPARSLARMREALADGDGAALTVDRTPRGGHALTLWVEHSQSALLWLARTAPAFAGSAADPISGGAAGSADSTPPAAGSTPSAAGPSL